MKCSIKKKEIILKKYDKYKIKKLTTGGSWKQTERIPPAIEK
jgi:hypothetical protein